MSARDGRSLAMANVYEEPTHDYEDDPDDEPEPAIDVKTQTMVIDGEDVACLSS